MGEVVRKIQRLLYAPWGATADERRRKLLNALLVIIMVATLVVLVIAIMSEVSGRCGSRDEIAMLYLGLAMMSLGSVLVLMVNRFSSWAAGWLLVLLMFVAIIFGDTPQQTASGRTLIAFTIPVVIASILLGSYTSIVIAGLGSLAVSLIALHLGMVVPTLEMAVLFIVAMVSALLAHILERTLTDLRAANKNLALLNQASRELSSTLDLDRVICAVLDEVGHLLNVIACSVWLIDPETGELICWQAIGPQNEVVRGWHLAPGEGVAGWVARTGESLIVPDAETEERYFGGVDQATGLALRSILSVPLRVRQDVIGVLQVTDTDIDRFRPADQELLEPLALTAAVAIENARLYGGEQQRAVALAHALEQQRELDRLKNEFIQNVSHELRTPLAIVRGYVELLEGGELGELQPDQREPMSIIVSRVRGLNELVDNLVATLAIEARELEREPVDLANLVHTLLTGFEATAERARLSLAIEIAPDLPQVSGDPGHLRRMLDNLFSNALKFTPAGGSIAIRLWQDGENAVLEVADTGIGVPQDQLARIFERFYQVNGSTTRRYGGTGLGLALVKEIVEAHGGQVTAQSSVGEGSTFRVTLPLAIAP